MCSTCQILLQALVSKVKVIVNVNHNLNHRILPATTAKLHRWLVYPPDRLRSHGSYELRRKTPTDAFCIRKVRPVRNSNQQCPEPNTNALIIQQKNRLLAQLSKVEFKLHRKVCRRPLRRVKSEGHPDSLGPIWGHGVHANITLVYLQYFFFHFAYNKRIEFILLILLIVVQ